MSHEFYVAMSYGATALALLAEIVMLRLRTTRARRLVEEERELEAQD